MKKSSKIILLVVAVIAVGLLFIGLSTQHRPHLCRLTPGL